MDLEKIKELMEAMKDGGITKIALKEKNGFELELERGRDFEVTPYHSMSHHVMPPTQVESFPQSHLPHKSSSIKEIEPKEGSEVTSPMVGTFYASASPEDEYFVKVGDVVKEDTVLCIIEAMKVMNEVKSGKSGVIAEIYIGNAQPVEFGSKLFRIV